MATHNKQTEATEKTKHNPTLAALLSIIPGLGQMYNKRFIKGSVILVLFAAFMIAMFDFLSTGMTGLMTLGVEERVDDSRVFLSEGILSLIFLTFLVIFYVLNILDARSDAKKLQMGWKVPGMVEGFRNAWDT